MSNFENIVETVVKNPNDNSISKLIENIEQFPPTDDDIIHLAVCLSNSGNTIHEMKGVTTADIPSTGGPSSLSTLLCPLYLRALGYVVPKLGIPGRPAGGIDVLAQIPGYKIDFTISEIEQLLKKSGYVHFLAAQAYAPLDAIIFSYRKRFGKINIPELAIASLLSKKLAVSVSLVGLDVRVAPHGNFGTSFGSASAYSKRFCSIARKLGMRAVCFLSDASIPYQPFIGRGEALLAVYNILTEKVDSWLNRHDDACYAMVNRLATFDTKNEAIKRPSTDMLYNVLKNNLKAQNTTFNHFKNYILTIKRKHKFQVKAPQSGFLNVDLEQLRSTIVKMQNICISPETPFPDPCGLILKFSSGTYIYKGEVVATVRCHENLSTEILKKLSLSLQVSNEPPKGLHFREISHE